MENLIKFLEEKITDKMPVEGIVDVFEQMCSTPLEEDMVFIINHKVIFDYLFKSSYMPV